MRKLVLFGVVGSMVGTAFVAGVAVGKATPQPKFIASEEVKWDDVGGPKLGLLTGDYKKGPYGALMKIPAGFTSPLHSHTGACEAVEIAGTSSHWMKGEDGTKAKKMTPGSYWSIPAKLEHVSACAPGTDCVMYIWQKTKFDYVPAKDAMPAKDAAPAKAKDAAPAKAKDAAPAKK
jgi:hypothetical protein